MTRGILTDLERNGQNQPLVTRHRARRGPEGPSSGGLHNYPYLTPAHHRRPEKEVTEEQDYSAIDDLTEKSHCLLDVETFDQPSRDGSLLCVVGKEHGTAWAGGARSASSSRKRKRRYWECSLPQRTTTWKGARKKKNTRRGGAGGLPAEF